MRYKNKSVSFSDSAGPDLGSEIDCGLKTEPCVAPAAIKVQPTQIIESVKKKRKRKRKKEQFVLAS